MPFARFRGTSENCEDAWTRIDRIPIFVDMNDERLLAHKLRNDLQTALLVGMLALLCTYLAWFIGGAMLAWGALIAVAVLFLLNPAASPRLVMSLYRGRPVGLDEAPRLYAIVRELSRRAGLERLPILYYMPTRMLNAFTSGGRSDAAIAVSDGLLRRLELRELAGVLAHEISHVANGDTRVMAFADLVSRLTGLLSLLGQVLLLVSLPLWLLGGMDIPWVPIAVLLFAPTLSALTQLALSRSREYEADRSAAELCGDPEGLASALEKLEYFQGSLWEQLVMPGYRIPAPSLLRTHPPTAERVRRLMELKTRERLPRPVPGLSLLGSVAPPEFLGDRQPGGPRWHISGLWY
ncbi:MAG: zinc metalloprotease HtpX [Pseudomonadota bacterium]|nr:zinc metalloprotease HtpX [Pseudomonadota bacterium]